MEGTKTSSTSEGVQKGQGGYIRWWNGPAQLEYQYLSGLLELTENSNNLHAIKSSIEGRMRTLKSEKNEYDYSVLVAFALGAMFGIGFGLAFFTEGTRDLGFFLVFLAIFHMWEYIYTSIYHPDECTIDSFMVNHSREYHMAMGLAFTEYLIEWYLFPSMKSSWFIMVPALIVVIGGQAIRTLAMWTAGSNFHHMIQTKKRDTHVLVTTGIYGYLRHPSYFGWYWWSVGMAVLLCNPITIAAFAYASWMFFADRIPYEEKTLIKHFGEEYKEYRKRVPTGIPFIP